MVLKSAEIASSIQSQASDWKNYNIDYLLIKLDIAKLVKKLNKLNESYITKIQLLQVSSTKTLTADGSDNNGDFTINSIGTSDSSVPIATKLSQFNSTTDILDVLKASNYKTATDIDSVSNYSSTSSSNGSSTNLLSQAEVSSKEVRTKIKTLAKAFSQKKVRLVVNFIKNSLYTQLKTVDLYINLKSFQLVKNFQSNSNNFKRNHKNIVKEVFSIQSKLFEYQKTLASEALSNHDFTQKLQDKKTNPDLSLPSHNGAKKLNFSVVSRNLQLLINKNRRLYAKVEEIKESLFLNLKSFAILQKEIVYHLIHYFNKIILKQSKDSNTGNDLSTYVNALYLVKKYNTLTKSADGIIGNSFFLEAQNSLILSFEERYEIYQYIFEDILNSPFDDKAIENVFGNTIYEREFIYFGKFKTKNVKAVKAGNIEHDGSQKFKEKLDNFLKGKQLSDHSIQFWNLNFGSLFDLINKISQLITFNDTMCSTVYMLIQVITKQRSLIYDPNQLNIIYHSNQLSDYLLENTLIEKCSSIIKNISGESSHDKSFDLKSCHCYNTGWFLVPEQYVYEVSFLLNSLFANAKTSNEEEINELITTTINEIDFKQRHKPVDPQKYESVSYFDSPDFNTKQLNSLQPVRVFSGYNDGFSLAIGVNNALGLPLDSTFNSTLMQTLAEDADLTNEVLFSTTSETIKKVIKEYFHDDRTEFTNFQKIFKQSYLNICETKFVKNRFQYNGSGTKHPNIYISLYSNIKFFHSMEAQQDFPYALLEVKWDLNSKFPDSLTKLVNADYLYEIPHFDPYVYCIMLFGLGSSTNTDWFAKLRNRKFDLKSIIDNRLYRSKQKIELANKLRQQQERSQRTQQNTNSRVDLFGNPKRYWNEFDDNPEEWGDDDRFYIDAEVNSRTELLSDSIINYLIDLSTSIKNASISLQLKVKNAISHTLGPNPRTQNEPPHNDISPYRYLSRPNRYLHTSMSSSNTGAYDYDSSDDERNSNENRVLRYDSIITDSGSHGYSNSQLHDETFPLFVYGHQHSRPKEQPCLDPEEQRIHNHDIIATFLYFVLPMVAAVITGSSLGIIYSVVLNPEIESSFFMLVVLVLSFIVAFLLSTLALVFLFGRINPAPIHHYVWVWSVFLAVLTSVVFILTEFVESGV